MDEQNNDRIPNILCLIAVFGDVLLVVLAMALDGFKSMTVGTFLGDVVTMLYYIVALLMLLAPVLSVAIVIYVRIKYPSNLFGKILMWILIIIVICIIAFIIFIISFCMWCENELRGCGFLILNWLLG